MMQGKDPIDTFDKMKEEYIKIQDRRIKGLKRTIAALEETIECHKEEIKHQNDFMNLLRQELAKSRQQPEVTQ
ncbi:MAG: hypothetical protein AUI84_15885 [Delftia sp. 13_1_40CM_3_66_6]|nr:MAG: hypothetical protein AUI84_15885 [Delftia sp. 13_1_40CM_3_66_6]